MPTKEISGETPAVGYGKRQSGRRTTNFLVLCLHGSATTGYRKLTVNVHGKYPAVHTHKALPVMPTFCGACFRVTRAFSAEIFRRSRSPCALPSSLPTPGAPSARTPCTRSTEASYQQRTGSKTVAVPGKSCWQSVMRHTNPFLRRRPTIDRGGGTRLTDRHVTAVANRNGQAISSNNDNKNTSTKRYTLHTASADYVDNAGAPRFSRAWRTSRPRRTPASP